MKRSLATSAVIHILVLIAAMVTLSAPAPLETPESTAMDVDIVQADQLQQGEKKAPVTDHVSRKQTTKQDQVANAQNVGENKVDIKNPVVPTQRPESETAALAPKKVETPVPQDDPRPNDAKTIEQQETEAAPKEVAAIPQQKPDVTPTPKPDPAPPTPKADATPTPPPAQQPADQAEIQLPTNAPVPFVKPQPTPPKAAEPKPDATPQTKPDPKVASVTPADKTATQSISKEKSVDDGKKDADKKRESAKGPKSSASDFNEDQISAMLNNTSSKGGAKRSSQQASAGADTQVASRGGMKSLGGGKLSQSQKDGLRDLISKNWLVIPGMEGASDVTIKVHVRLDKSGQIIGTPEVSVSGGPTTTQNALRGAAERAVMKSRADLQKEVNAGGLLPPDKYDGSDGWNELVLNFDPRDLGM